jgi:hypothetical protein
MKLKKALLIGLISTGAAAVCIQASQLLDAGEVSISLAESRNMTTAWTAIARELAANTSDVNMEGQAVVRVNVEFPVAGGLTWSYHFPKMCEKTYSESASMAGDNAESIMGGDITTYNGQEEGQCTVGGGGAWYDIYDAYISCSNISSTCTRTLEFSHQEFVDSCFFG